MPDRRCLPGTICSFLAADARVPTKAMLRAGGWIDEGYLPRVPKTWQPPPLKRPPRA